ncbi:DegV family protein [Thermoactinomyces mirandus]|uniref:DegV family protein n=1 Tax=Thermoactinomyces mirandus TaxID=2756294 RepID=A0A7W2ASE8_9BACL|nr:DegV family protein [Thermoactinomyces mirandus]MBA4602406.1 DegV family protein [Thermoactinomyces mirandus]
MEKVKIITDSTADIPKQLAKDLGISVIPINVHVAGKCYQDGLTISPNEFYRKMRSIEELPTTSQPSPLDIVGAYKKAINNGAKQILSLHISSKMSGTYQSCLLAKSMVEEEFPDVTIEVVDCKTVTYALGIIVVMVARAAQEGRAFSELMHLAERIREVELLLATVDTLEYLHKGGRIGKAKALVGALLNIKPIITISDDGEIAVVDIARGQKKANQKIFELLKKKIPAGPVAVAALHADNKQLADLWMEKIEDLLEVKEKVMVDIGPAVGTHCGPGTVACVVVSLDELSSGSKS